MFRLNNSLPFRVQDSRTVSHLPERAEEALGIGMHNTVMHDLAFENFVLVSRRQMTIDEEV